MHLTKEMKDLYAENYKILMKEIEDTNKSKVFHVHVLEELIVLNCQYCQSPPIGSIQFLSRFQ